jgi:filamentous hemagglutinin family protein
MLYDGINAEVVFDGTVGLSSALEGPDFKITADFGRLEGNNLFHSFSQFDLLKDESATFSGPDAIQNIIGRVTGGKRSSIDGKLQSSIPQANLYLLNPDGFIFGPNASLNVGGSLYISTASILSLGNEGHFNTRNPEQSVFVSAPPVAFGFLDPKPASIEIQGSNLSVAETKTLSLSSGKITIDHGRLEAVLGRVNLVGVNYTEALKMTVAGPLVDKDAQLGEVILKNQASIDVGKQNSGKVFIRSGQFILEESDITGNTFSEPDSGITIEVDELFLNKAKIDTRTFGTAQGGKIVMQVTGRILLINSEVLTTSRGTETNAGNAGDINLTAQNLTLSDSTISTETFGGGQGGDINIAVREDIILIGFDDELETAIQARSAAQKTGGGDAGRIVIKAKNLSLQGATSKIDNSTLGTGHGGNITLETADTLRLVNGALISADSRGSGNAGSVNVNTTTLTIDNSIISTAADHADGGNIIINVDSQLDAKDSQISATVSGGAGNGGNLVIGNPQFFRLRNSVVSANASGGNGGAILIITGTPIEAHNSQITASSEKGIDGDVKIDMFNVNLTALPIDFLDASLLIKKRCVGRSSNDESSNFRLRKREGLPNAPDDLQIYLPTRHCSKIKDKKKVYNE